MSIIYTPPSPPVVICFTLLSFLLLLFKLYKFSCLLTQALSFFLWISSTTYSFSISAPALLSMMPLIWGRWGIQLKPGEHESLGPLFCHGSRWGHSFFWNIWLEQRSYYLKVICSVQTTSLLVIQLEQVFVGSFWSVLVGISRLPASSPPSLGFIRKREKLGNSPPCYTMGPQGSQLVCFFLPTFQSLPMFILCIISKFFSCSQYIFVYSNFLEAKSQCTTCFCK